MDVTYILNLLSELAYLLITFGVFLVLAVFKGRQFIINIIFGLYLALLISLEFPFYEEIIGGMTDSGTIAAIKLGIFGFFTLLMTWLSARVMPEEFRERKTETLGKKILLAAAATVLVMTFSFNALPITEFMTPGTPIQSLFAPAEFYFYWLLAPLVILFII